jgi:hypothetical protein
MLPDDPQDLGASADADQALVASDQAASRLAPSGFDPSRIFARAGEILKERFPGGTVKGRELEAAVRDAIGELMLGGFRVGQRVRHSNGREGVIRHIKDGAVHVAFDDENGRVGGIYDAKWFRYSGATLTAIAMEMAKP